MEPQPIQFTANENQAMQQAAACLSKAQGNGLEVAQLLLGCVQKLQASLQPPVPHQLDESDEKGTPVC